METPLYPAQLCLHCIDRFKPEACRTRCNCTSPHFPRSGTVGALKDNEDFCSFCEYICGLLRIEPFVPSAEGYNPRNLTWDLKEATSPWNSNTVSSRRKLFNLRLEGIYKAQILVLLQVGIKDVKKFVSRRFDKKPIDMLLVQEYLRMCSKTHVQCSKFATRTDHESDIILIDLHTKCLIAATSAYPYFALSHVRGPRAVLELSTKNADWLFKQGSLSRAALELPNVVRDAMELTKAAGQRYLWCDSLCICQDDAATKHSQISQMDRIYSNATLTLVALSGESAWDPIPGATYGTRPKILLDLKIEFASTSVVNLGDRNPTHGSLIFEAYRPRLSALLEGSPYETRAWTLQERIMSPRCLYFTRYHAFLHCQELIWNEDPLAYLQYKGRYSPPEILPFKQMLDQAVDDSNTGSAPEPSNHRNAQYNDSLSEREPVSPILGWITPSSRQDSGVSTLSSASSFSVNKDFWPFNICYADLVETYTERKLTYSSDILSAVSGIFDAIASATNQEFLFGMPKSSMPFAMLWSPVDQFRRRVMDSPHGVVPDGIPSWSWASCEGAVTYRSILTWTSQSEKIRTQPTDMTFTTTSVSLAGRVLSFSARSFSMQSRAMQPLDTSFLCRENVTFMRPPFSAASRRLHCGVLLSNIEDLGGPFSPNAQPLSEQDHIVEIARSKGVNQIITSPRANATGRPGKASATTTSMLISAHLGATTPIGIVHVMLVRRVGSHFERRAVGVYEAGAWDGMRPEHLHIRLR